LYAPLLLENRSTVIMVKKMELSIDEKPKLQVWTVAGVKTAEIADCSLKPLVHHKRLLLFIFFSRLYITSGFPLAI
jgi:hypothetical protein